MLKNLPKDSRRHSIVLDNLDVAVCVLDVAGRRILYANPDFEACFGKGLAGGPVGELEALLPEKDGTGEDISGTAELFWKPSERWFAVRRRHAVWPDGLRALVCSAWDITAWKKQEAGITEQAYTDYLTGLPNRRACDRELAARLERFRDSKIQFYLFFMDLDDFKVVNDSFGHDYGDGVLLAFAGTLRRHFSGQDKIFRLGGDEFVVMVDPDNNKLVPEYLEKLLERAGHPWPSRDREFYCTLSIGVVEFSPGQESVGSILKKADLAMYQAKKSGKNSYVCFREGLDRETLERSEIEGLLRSAIKDGFSGFEILYQPYYRLEALKNGGARLCIRGAEALLRLRGLNNELLSPQSFIGLAEYLGLIVPIGEHVMTKVAGLCRRLNENGHPEFSMNINLSAVQLKHSEMAMNMVAVLRATGVNLNNIIVAVNEGVALDVKRNSLDYCAEFRKCGLQVALDDFGSGNASFINMRALPVDIVKLAPVCLGAYPDEFAEHFIKLAVYLGHHSGKSVCVTGVETAEHLEFCRQIKTDMVQGYLFHRPDSEAKLLELLEKEAPVKNLLETGGSA
ncbi:MAG: EAL domain-containing protein [Desulfovibrionaceae bacterium]|nr:EAL domain-containing protein [Desulfovibrionaceae bacterium]